MRSTLLMAGAAVLLAQGASRLEGRFFSGRIGGPTQLLQLTQRGHEISGTGNLNFEAMCTAAITVNGTVDKHPGPSGVGVGGAGGEKVTLALTADNPDKTHPQCQSVTFKGTFSGDTLTGVETTSPGTFAGGPPLHITFTRQAPPPPAVPTGTPKP